MLTEIFKYFGTKKALADALNVKPQAITHWEKRGVPTSCAIKIEQLTGGKFKAVDIVSEHAA